MDREIYALKCINYTMKKQLEKQNKRLQRDQFIVAAMAVGVLLFIILFGTN